MLESIALMLRLWLCSLVFTDICGPTEILPADPYSIEAADIALAQARSQQDWRLLSLAGRVPNLPGIVENYETMKKHCGVRYLSTTDHITEPQQLQVYKQIERYATHYNQQMQILCLEHNPLL